MNIVSIHKIEGCLEGSNVVDVYFDRNISRAYAISLGRHGRLIIKEEIDKPFFKVILRGKFTMKGSVGNDNLRVILPEGTKDALIPELRRVLEESI